MKVSGISLGDKSHHWDAVLLSVLNVCFTLVSWKCVWYISCNTVCPCSIFFTWWKCTSSFTWYVGFFFTVHVMQFKMNYILILSLRVVKLFKQWFLILTHSLSCSRWLRCCARLLWILFSNLPHFAGRPNPLVCVGVERQWWASWNFFFYHPHSLWWRVTL